MLPSVLRGRKFDKCHPSGWPAEEARVASEQLPMVVMTVPAKKKALPRSQWLLLLEEFPIGLTPALSASRACCKESERARGSVKKVKGKEFSCSTTCSDLQGTGYVNEGTVTKKNTTHPLIKTRKCVVSGGKLGYID